jgi:hypothetical protein
VQGHEVQLIENGVYQLAMVSLNDWGKLETLDTNGLNPVQPASTLLNAGATLHAGQPTLLATLLRWKKSGTQWTDAELSPVRQLMPAASGATVVLADGTHHGGEIRGIGS